MIYWTGICKQTRFKMFSLHVLLIVTFMAEPSTGVSHSLRYFYTAVSGTLQFPEFAVVGYVDDNAIGKYEISSQRFVPVAQWMEKIEDPNYWERNSQVAQSFQQQFKANVRILMERTNQTSGIHTVQVMYGCFLNNDGTTTGLNQHAFDGKDFISFNKGSLTWTAAAPYAVITKNKWDPNTALAMQWKGYLEQTCIEWLNKYIQYGQSSLEQKVEPVVKVTDKTDGDRTKLKCTVTGFHPRDIDVHFYKDDKDQMQATESTGVLPNSDGTYYTETWIEIAPQDKYRYSCHVEHGSLTPTLIVKPDPESNNVLIIVIAVVGGLLLLAAVVGGVVFWKRRRTGGQKYAAANKTEHGESSSNSSANA